LGKKYITSRSYNIYSLKKIKKRMAAFKAEVKLSKNVPVKGAAECPAPDMGSITQYTSMHP
jgi:hypothetical protein